VRSGLRRRGGIALFAFALGSRRPPPHAGTSRAAASAKVR
jgi:hypothetical protein